MKKNIALIFLLLTNQGIGTTQDLPYLDSLKNELSIATQDTSRALLMASLCNYYMWNRPDSAIYYGNKAVLLARQIKFPKAELRALGGIVLTHLAIGNDSRALQINLEAIKIAEKNYDLRAKSTFLRHSGELYTRSKNYYKALSFFKESKKAADSLGDWFSIIGQGNIAETFLLLNQLDSALYYGLLANDNADQELVRAKPFTLRVLGKIYFESGDYDRSLVFFQQALQISRNSSFIFKCNYYIAQIYQETLKLDSCIYYAKKALEVSEESGIYSLIIDANILLSGIYEKPDPEKALQFSKSAIAYKDSLDDLRIRTGLEAFTDYDEQERQYELEAAKISYQNWVQRLWIFSIAGALLTALLVAIILYRNNKNKQKANAILKEQKEEIQVTLEKLKSTQSQLIQAEKMASLGELTAGIAHEIQNPLNFVNNFAEVSKELAEELNEEVLKTKIDTELISEIAGDLVTNQEKINHHGQRASGIVKGMLEHSRTSTGKKELTDINILADEYLRLAYHGLRAKDKSFNADFKLELDESLPKVNVIPQDIGRVLLNLINNAFYAVDKKSKKGIDAYQPQVIVSTKKNEKTLEITVQDNGEGIPDQVRNKIFQPFFTTKPTGSGTGLGLSLAYDIITKGHNGYLEVETEEGMGTRFVVRLPVV